MSEVQKVNETGEGRYLYCVINSGAKLSFGNIGINDSGVYTVPHKDIAAVVHSCIPKPYETDDNEKAKEWILAHNYVIDQKTKKFGTVVPFSFDAIIKGNDDTIKDWLTGSYGKVKGELERLENKSEYTIQIFCEENKFTEDIMSNDQELKVHKDKMTNMSKGTAYLLQKQFELKIKDIISNKMSKLAIEFGSGIKEYVEELRVEKKTTQVPEKYKDKKMIVSFSCLVRDDNIEEVGEVLDEINNRDAFAVRFTGPWAPFSFIKLEEV